MSLHSFHNHGATSLFKIVLLSVDIYRCLPFRNIICRFWHTFAFTSVMTYATCKPIEVFTPPLSLTLCIFDDDPADRDSLTTLISDMGYDAAATGDSDEALRLIRLGRCRLVFASFHLTRMIRMNSLRAPFAAALEAIRRGASDFLPVPLIRPTLNAPSMMPGGL